MIPQETIDRILESTNIVDVIGEFVSLKRSGSNYKALCPFHNEKTPSFMVSESKGIWRCFGCGEAGNIISFLMRHEGFNYPEAIQWLGKRIGIEVNLDKDEKQSPVNLRDVQDFFVTKGKTIVPAYMQQRHFMSETYSIFGVGHSPKENIISENAKNKEILFELGVLGKSDNRYYDRFRGRITWPYVTISGKVIGWTGRGNDPKYLNSPQSNVFDKSKNLLNIYNAKKYIKQEDKCYLVEGPTDVMRMYESGYKNTVSSNGTSFTKDMALLIKRFSDNVVILYDGDIAGVKATESAIDILLGEDMNPKVCSLSNGDPDEYLQKNNKLPNELDWMDYYLQGEDLQSDPTYVSILTNEVLKKIKLIPDEIKRILYTRKLSGILNVKEELLGRNIMLKPDNITETKSLSAIALKERYIAWIIINYGNEIVNIEGNEIKLRDYILNDLTYDEIPFTDPIVDKTVKECAGDVSFAQLLNNSDPEISSLVSEMSSNDLYPKDIEKGILVKESEHAILNLKNIYVSEKKNEIQMGIKKAQEAGDMDECFELMKLNQTYHDLSMRIGKSLGRVIN